MAAQVEIRESLGAQTLARVEFIAKYGVDRCQAERFCCVLGVRVCYVLLSLGIIDLHRHCSLFHSSSYPPLVRRALPTRYQSIRVDLVATSYVEAI